MNLYLFNDNDSAAVYGIGTYLNELTQALHGAADIHVHVVHLHSSRPKFEIEKTGKVENWHIPDVRYKSISQRSIQKMEDYFRNVVYLFQLHIKDTKDLIFHFNYNNCYDLAKELKAVFNCKTVAAVHFTKWQLQFNGNPNNLHTLKSKPKEQRNSLEQVIYTAYEYESFLYKEVDQVIVLSLYMQHILETEYQIDAAKISVIPNGLTEQGFQGIAGQARNDKDIKNLRAKWNLSSKEKIILFAGRLDTVKGLVFLIKAFREVLEKYPDCRLMIAGSSGNYDTFFQEAKDICTKITFTGLLKKEDLYALYQIADAGIVPSLFETFGYVAVEMMMHGLPLVATATSGLNEVIDESCGLKIPLTVLPDKVEIDTNILAEKIVYLLQHPDEAKKMGQNGRKRYLKEYTSEVFRRNMLQFYTSLSTKC